jgi:hypothetical protein
MQEKRSRSTAANRAELKRIRTQGGVFAARMADREEKQVRDVDAERDKAMDMALEHYFATVRGGTALRHDLAVFRLVALWFDGQSTPFIMDRLRRSWAEVRSDKWLVLLPQLAARLAPCKTAQPDTATFAGLLQTVIGESRQRYI